MERKPFKEGASTIEARATQLLAHAEWMANSGQDRTAVFWGIFGLRGSYVTLFPTMDDRLALRDLPARRELFALILRTPLPEKADHAGRGQPGS